MRYTRNVIGVAAIAALSIAPVVAAAAQTPSPQAVKAAADATRAAQKITLEARNGSGVSGSVGLFTIGRSRTRIVVQLPAGGKYRLMLHPGSDCSGNRTATLADVALSPTSFSKTRAATSTTIVSLPIEKIRSNYVVDVRDATSQASLAAACGRLNR